MSIYIFKGSVFCCCSLCSLARPTNVAWPLKNLSILLHITPSHISALTPVYNTLTAPIISLLLLGDHSVAAFTLNVEASKMASSLLTQQDQKRVPLSMPHIQTCLAHRTKQAILLKAIMWASLRKYFSQKMSIILNMHLRLHNWSK